MATQRTALIIGGGIGGAVAAVAVQKAGIEPAGVWGRAPAPGRPLPHAHVRSVSMPGTGSPEALSPASADGHIRSTLALTSAPTRRATALT